MTLSPGRVLFRGEPGYEQARTGRIFNARRPDRFPAAILLAVGDDDVAEGVRLAARRGWPVAVRSLHRPGTAGAGKPASPADAALRAGFGHVAFDVTDLDAACQRAVERGGRPVMPPGPSPQAGVRMAFIVDPEGNLIEFLHRP